MSRDDVDEGADRAPSALQLQGPCAQKTVVIVGNGMTSWRLCHELVSNRAGANLRIVVIGQEEHPAYDRVRLTSLLAGASIDELLLAGREWYSRAGIELHLGETVIAIDRERRLVRSDRRTIAYDELVLATGSVPWVPPIPGADRPGVFVYRTIADLEAIRRYGSRRRRALVVGGGLLGLEAAKAVVDLGLAVDVIESFPTLMPRQLDTEGGERLAACIRELDVAVHTGKRIAAIIPDGPEGGGHLARFAEGGGLAADLVIIAAGVRPATGLARAAGLELGPQGAIVVDDELRTSDASIYAVGECVTRAGATFGLVAPGYQMVRVLAGNLVGKELRFQPTSTTARLKVLGVEVSSIGEIDGASPGTSTETYRRRDAYRKVIVRSGCLTGAVAVGAWPGFDRVAQAVTERERVSVAALRRFRRRGELWAAPVAAGELPETAIVCSCMQVTRGQIEAARRSGCVDARAVCRETTAASMCGSCRPVVEEITALVPTTFAVGTPPRGLVLPPPRPDRAGYALTVLSGVALLAAGLLVTVGLAPFLPVDRLLPTEPTRTFRLWTGFGALALATLTLVLPLRKRWRRLAAGSVSVWRAVHGLLGASTVGLVVAHTGLHFGSHLNHALFLDYLAVIIVGALAGIVFGATLGLPAIAVGRLRRFWARLHLAMLWPLPVLAALHVLAAYFY